MRPSSLLPALSVATVLGAAESPNVLWYREPARTWHEALPVGNGRIGALVLTFTATAGQSYAVSATR